MELFAPQAARGHLAMLLFSLLVAGSFSLGAIVANDISPAALNTVRFFIAGAVIGTAAIVTTGIPKSATRAPWRYILLGGIFAGYFVLMFEGLKTATAVSASAVFTLTPIISAFAGYFLLKQITTTWMAAALAIGAGSAVWVIFRGDVSEILAFNLGRGELIYFVGCIAHAIYTPLVRKLNRGEPPIVFTFGTLLGGFGVLLVWGWSDILATDWAGLSAIVWITLFYVSICASSMTFVLLQYATLRLPSAKVMAYTYLTPSWVILWELALGKGLPPLVTLGGVALTFIALAMLLKAEPASNRKI